MNGTQDAENVISELRSSLEQVVKERYGINYTVSLNHMSPKKDLCKHWICLFVTHSVQVTCMCAEDTNPWRLCGEWGMGRGVQNHHVLFTSVGTNWNCCWIVSNHQERHWTLMLDYSVSEARLLLLLLLIIGWLLAMLLQQRPPIVYQDKVCVQPSWVRGWQ